MPDIRIRFIGKTPDDRRWFITENGHHAGGITVHSIQGDCFSYGIAVSPAFRRQGIAKAALTLLFEEMMRQGFANASVEIRSDNAASLALHQSLGFIRVSETDFVIRMEKPLTH